MNKRLWAEIRIMQGMFRLTVIMQVMNTLFLIAQAWALSQIISKAFLNGMGFDNLTNWVILGIIGILGRAITSAIATISAAKVATRVKAELRGRTMNHLRQLGPAFIQSERSGEIVTTLTEGVEKLDVYFRAYLPAMILALVAPLCIILFILPLDLLTFIVFLFTAPLIPIFMALIGMSAGRLARQQHGRMSMLGAHFIDVMAGLTTLRLLNRSLFQVKTIQKITDDFRHATMAVLRVAFLSALSLELLATLSVAIVAVEIGVRLLHGGILFEHALFLLILAPEFYMPLRTLGARFHSGTEGKAVAERIYALLDSSTPIPPAPFPHAVEKGGDSHSTNTHSLHETGNPNDDMIYHVPTADEIRTEGGENTWHAIRFESVQFAYSPDRPALNGVSFIIPRRAQVAVVGESGSGKTTLAMLILGFISPQAGKIMIGDNSLTDLNIRAWRKQIAWVSQKPYLFNMSIKDNIRIGNPHASDADMIRAAQDANAHDFIIQLHAGYDTPCGERGVQLSGGQAQRIAIARAFLKNAPILILDEPTANLDADSEGQVIGALAGLTKNRTVLSIAHRLDTITYADMILVMQNGRLVEQGTHQTLLAQNGYYAQLRKNHA